MPSHNALRRVYRVETLLEGAPDQVFPLLCPVREYDWIDGWQCTMVYSDSGVAEAGAIFLTAFPDLGEETWTVSRYEPGRAIAFVRVAPRVAVVTLEIELEPADAGRTRARWTHVYTALGPDGERAIEERTEAVNEADVRALERMINHFLKTGQKLPWSPEEDPAARRAPPGSSR